MSISSKLARIRRWRRWFKRPPVIERPPSARPATTSGPEPVRVRLHRWDGQETEVDCVLCPGCKNYFWTQHLLIEPPVRCPFCPVEFAGVNLVGNAYLATKQVL